MRLWTLGLLDNPVVVKEFRGRMRGARAYWLLGGYLLLLSLTLFVAYLNWWNGRQGATNLGEAGFTVGRTFFLTLFYVQAVLVTLITPALTAGAISLEREQRTYEMLRATTLPPRDIALGKLASSASFIVLLLTSSLPLVSVCFLLGGVSPGEVFFAYLLLVADAFLFGAVGLAWSAHAANTATATALSYGTLFLWFALTFPFAIPTLNTFTPSLGMGALNPVGAVAGAVLLEHYYGWTVPAWAPALLIIGTLGTLLVLACINRLEDDPARRAGPLRLTALSLCALLLFIGNGMIFGPTLGAQATGQMVALMSLALAAVLVFVPALVTGEAAGGPPWRLLTAALPSGLPFALLLTALICGLMFLGLHLGGAMASLVAPGGFGRQRGTSLGFMTPGLLMPLLWQASALLAAVVIGLGGVGFLLSRLLHNRWAALTVLYLLLVLGMAVPFFSYATLSGPDATRAMQSPAINTLYLCPLMGLEQLSSYAAPPHQGQSRSDGVFVNEHPVVLGMAGDGTYLWIKTALLYLGLGVVCYGVGRVVRRETPPVARATGTPPVSRETPATLPVPGRGGEELE